MSGEEMYLKGVLAYLLHCEPEHQREFNLWYDTDHVPENRALPGIFHAQRYVAPAAFRSARGRCELKEEGGNYLTVYFTERDVWETRGYMAELSTRMHEADRFPDYFRPLFGGVFYIDGYAVRKGFELAAGAVPVYPHSGLYVIIDELTDESEESRLLEWYNGTEIPRMLECRGVIAAFRFRCREQRYLNRFLSFYFIEGDPLAAAREINGPSSEGRKQELPDICHRIFSGPYQAIVPMQHGFLDNIDK